MMSAGEKMTCAGIRFPTKGEAEACALHLGLELQKPFVAVEHRAPYSYYIAEELSDCSIGQEYTSEKDAYTCSSVLNQIYYSKYCFTEKVPNRFSWMRNYKYRVWCNNDK